MNKGKNMDVIKELSSNKTILVKLNSDEYNDTVINIAKKLSGKKVCYITLSKSFESLKELFEKNKVNITEFIFVDAISRTFKKTPEKEKNCYYVDSPGSLTDIAIIVGKLLKQDSEYLIFDSLTNILVYHPMAPVARFISNIVNKINASSAKAVFYAIVIKEQELIIEESSMFVDKILYTSKFKK